MSSSSSAVSVCCLLLLLILSTSSTFAFAPSFQPFRSNTYYENLIDHDPCLKGTRNQQRSSSSVFITSHNDDVDAPLEVQAEVVGASGRIGSLFLRTTATTGQEQRQMNGSIGVNKAIPRGIAPGCWSSLNKPIFVCTPAKAWPTILRNTIPNRREDLVWIGNGITPGSGSGGTIVVPHFGILEVNGEPITSSESPPTYVWGKHSRIVETILRSRGINQIERMETHQEITIAAAEKLLWASSMWLLCHKNYRNTNPSHDANNTNTTTTTTTTTTSSNNNNAAPSPPLPPRTVVQIYTNDLNKLVTKELVPALQARLRAMTNNTTMTIDAKKAIEYMKRYSASMPQAIPSLKLAQSEWKERNGFFLHHTTAKQVSQPFHQQLLQQVGNISLEEISKQQQQQQQLYDESSSSSFTKTVAIPLLGFTVVGRRKQYNGENITNTTGGRAPPAIKTALIVGGGILGSSVALHLARQQEKHHHHHHQQQQQQQQHGRSSSSSSSGSDVVNLKIHVIDSQQPQQVFSSTQQQQQLGRTTPASWAWLNANGKSPPMYSWLNQLGMESWRRDPTLKDLPTWCGSLVRTGGEATAAVDGGYVCEGPLMNERLKELEPFANWQDDDGDNSSGNESNGNNKQENDDASSSVYYYPEEGFVDPFKAVQTTREEATKLGVEFHMGYNVSGFTRNETTGELKGVLLAKTAQEGGGGGGTTVHTSVSCIESEWEADVVILAAGMGSADLGKIPMLHRPGQIAFAEPSSDEVRLQRILVDTVRESHVLQRRDGSMVIGGGALEVGGDGAVALATNGGLSSGSQQQETKDQQQQHPLLKLAEKLVPGAIHKKSPRTEQALRPIPLDGLPAIGYIAPEIYCVVSHSGMTLAPILGALAATEITECMDIDGLETFRPTRFFPQTS